MTSRHRTALAPEVRRSTTAYLRQKALAALLGLSVRQVQNLTKPTGDVFVRVQRDGIPVYELARSLLAWGEYRVAIERRKVPKPANFLVAQARKMEADASMAEHSLAEMNRQLVSVEEYELEMASVRRRLLASARSVLTKFVGEFQQPLDAAKAQVLCEKIGDDLVRAMRSAEGDEIEAGDGAKEASAQWRPLPPFSHQRPYVAEYPRSVVLPLSS